MLKAEIVADVEFLRTEDGGRSNPLRADIFGCPLEYRREYYDCRLDLTGLGPIGPGDRASVPIQFLRPELVVPRLNAGSRIALWEGRRIVRGTVVKV